MDCATSLSRAKASRTSRSYSSDQKCASVAPRINWAWTRIRLPSRITDPSTRASTRSVLAISGAESSVCLYCIADVWEITRRPRMLESRPMRSSVIPSAKYSCDLPRLSCPMEAQRGTNPRAAGGAVECRHCRQQWKIEGSVRGFVSEMSIGGENYGKKHSSHPLFRYFDVFERHNRRYCPCASMFDLWAACPITSRLLSRLGR